jgi:hypothetical protein
MTVMDVLEQTPKNLMRNPVPEVNGLGRGRNDHYYSQADLRMLKKSVSASTGVSLS